MGNVLEIKDLNVSIKSREGRDIVKGVSLNIKEGEIHGLVGESGSGKSFTAKSILRLHDESATQYKGAIIYNNQNLLELKESEFKKFRERDISYIFQNPTGSFDNLFTVGEQIEETLRYVAGYNKSEAKSKSYELLESVGVTPAKKRAKQYPYEFSGGMLQRSMIALAIACNPKLLIADEATTALDVTMQARVLQLFKKLRDERNLSVLCITHDLGVVAEICDTVSVMYVGRIVETNDVRNIFNSPKHEYTKHLLRSFKEVS